MTAATLCKFGELPAVCITAPDGAEAIVTLYGAHLVSWTLGDGKQRLFCSKQSRLDGRGAIRGGMPVIFPQFGARGNGLRHGFARICHWRLEDSGQHGDACYAQFSLDAADLPPALARAWPFEFALQLRITLQGDALDVALTVRNSGSVAFPFSAALHTYFLVDSVDLASVHGLQRVRFADHDHHVALQEEDVLQFDGKLDRIYFQVPGAVTLRTGAGADAVTVGQEGFTDVVVWNPGFLDACALSDLADNEYRQFVCVEPALIEPDLLAAGAQWTGRQRVKSQA